MGGNWYEKSVPAHLVSIQYRLGTVGQTDRQTDTTTAYTALAWRRAVKIADSDALSTARFLACREN